MGKKKKETTNLKAKGTPKKAPVHCSEPNLIHAKPHVFKFLTQYWMLVCGAAVSSSAFQPMFSNDFLLEMERAIFAVVQNENSSQSMPGKEF